MIDYRRRRPRLYRLARYLRWCSILALVVVLLFLASTVISAIQLGTHLSVTPSGNRGYSFNVSASSGFTASFEVNITNAGYYPLVLDLSAEAHSSQGPLIPLTSTGAVTVTPGNTATEFGLTIHIPETTLASDGAQMLVQNMPVAGNVWFNGSYAWIYQFGFSIVVNGTWGAPFENLTVLPNSPTTAGGQTTVPVALHFTNNAFFADVGNLTFQVVDSGTNCGPPVGLPVDVAAHENFSGKFNLTGPSSCMVPGATVTTTYAVGPLAFSLPSVRLG